MRVDEDEGARHRLVRLGDERLLVDRWTHVALVGLARRQVLALLQQLDGDPVRRADERHVAVPWRAVDRHAAIDQALANLVDIAHPIRQMPEMTAVAGQRIIAVPVIGQLDDRRLGLLRRFDVIRGGKENIGVAALLTLRPARFDHAQQVAEEVQRGVEVRDPDHGVQIFHGVILWHVARLV